MPLLHSYVLLAVAVAMPPSRDALKTSECAVAGSATTKGAHFFLEAVKPLVRDTVLTARLCLVPPRAGVGSYSVTLTFDSTVMRAVRVDVSGGLQAKNMMQ